jgi:hypothetical protein
LRSADGESTLGLVTIAPELVGLIPTLGVRTLSVRDPEPVRSAAVARGALVSDEGDALIVVDPDGRKWRIVTAMD